MDEYAAKSATQERLANWEQYLRWNKRLLKSRMFGCRYVDLKVDPNKGRLVITLVYPDKEQFKKKRSKLSGDMRIYDLSCSQDEWVFKLNNFFDNFNTRRKIKEKKLGAFAGIGEGSLQQFEDGIERYTVEVLYELTEEYQKEYDNIDWDKDPMSISDFRELEEQIKARYKTDGFLAESAVGSFVLNERLEEAVKNLKYDTNCCSPYLSSWLFDIKQARLPDENSGVEIRNWLNPNIEKNKNQKQAVIKMLKAPDVCLVQGPPGTGKTTVIAEAIYQFAARGNRILISSQSNDAVDNALSRLKNSPDIRAIRLERSKKDNNDDTENKFSEDAALEFFYQSLFERIDKEWGVEADKKRKACISDCDKDSERIEEIESNRRQEKEKSLNGVSKDELTKQIEHLNKLIDYQESYSSSITPAIKSLNVSTVEMLCKELPQLIDEAADKGIVMFPPNLSLDGTNNNTKFSTLRSKIITLHSILKKMDNGEALINLKKQSECGCFNEKCLDFEVLNGNLHNTNESRERIKKVLNKYDATIRAIIEKMSKNKSTTNDYLSLYRQEMGGIANRYEINGTRTYSTLKEAIYNEKCKREKEVNKYDFWKNTINGFCKRLTDKKLFKVDQEYYQDKYINSCNVVGATCTASMKDKNRKQYKDFDVVIIDEVSKATPPELLIPLMKAKKAILVGDHRQLPPIFKEHEKSYTEMIEAIKTKNNDDSDEELLEDGNDDDLLTVENFSKFKDMVTASLFKEYFEQADDSIKCSLLTQYRMHSDIMNIINRFYENKLQAGLSPEKENAVKNHGLTIRGVNKMKFIHPDCHAYWIDSSALPSGAEFYENFQNGSTSAANILEQYIIIELLKKMAEEYTRKGYGKEKKKTVGIISFYMQQIRDIKKMYQKELKSNPNLKALDVVVNTVDQFQGQEKNIIICSLVRNNKQGRASGHVVAFERMNVAFSRAQELLVIVGAKHLYEDSIVTLPYMDQEGERKIPAYKDIMDELSRKAAFATSSKIITEDVEKRILSTANKKGSKQ